MAREHWYAFHVPKEHRARVREEFLKLCSEEEIRQWKRDRLRGRIILISYFVLITVLYFSQIGMWFMTAIVALLTIRGLIDMYTDDYTRQWHYARRLTAAVRAAGLEAKEPTRQFGVKAHLACLMPRTPYPVHRDWDWVRRGRALAQQRLVHRDLFDLDDMLKHRRKRLRLYGCLFLALAAFGVLFLLYSPLSQYAITKNDPAIDDLVDLILGACLLLGFAACIGYALFYTIHERWRPTWAALNALNAPTCMHCGHDLRSLNAEHCPECAAPVEQREMQRILLLDHIIHPESCEESDESDDADRTSEETELDWDEQELLSSYLD